MRANDQDHMNRQNRVLLLLIWLRQYPTVDLLALLFQVGKVKVSNVIRTTLPVLWEYFRLVCPLLQLLYGTEITKTYKLQTLKLFPVS